MEKKELIKRLERKNRTFGIDRKFLSSEDKEFLKGFAKYVKENNIRSSVIVRVDNTDKNGIINRISIKIENDKYLIKFFYVYCGGLYGGDRVFEVLYNFEYLLSDLIKEEFKHYEEYSLSNKIVYWEDLF